MKERAKPETLRLRSLTPSLTVDDVQVSLAFYRDILGFTVKETFEDEGRLAGAILEAGTVELFLSQDDFAEGRDRSKGVGLRLWCGTAQDLDELAADVEARGGSLAEPLQERPWGARDFTIVDPDGFKLSFTTVRE